MRTRNHRCPPSPLLSCIPRSGCAQRQQRFKGPQVLAFVAALATACGNASAPEDAALLKTHEAATMGNEGGPRARDGGGADHSGKSDQGGTANDSAPRPDLRPARCGDGQRNGTEACDGDDLGGKSCKSLGYFGGELSCSAGCRHDLSRCTNCGNGRIDAGEYCEGANLLEQSCTSRGFSSGTLRCSTTCTYDESGCKRASCGDGKLNGGEPCEGGLLGGKSCSGEGFDGGSLACTANCSLDTSACFRCGDGIANGAEDCDGADLRNAGCTSYGYDGGQLACSGGCRYDSAACYRCGDGIIAGPELCEAQKLGGRTCQDEGFSGGTLRCSKDCRAFDTSACFRCGDGVRNGGEESCDGQDLGPASCESLGFDGGSLSCAKACSFDSTKCTTRPPWEGLSWSLPLRAVWVSPQGSVWAAGRKGAVARSRGSYWQAIDPRTNSDLHAIWGRSDSDVWAAGTKTLMHFDGKSWRSEDPSSVTVWRGLWANGDRVLAVGNNNGSQAIAERKGSKWTIAEHNELGELRAIWGSSPDDIWVVGSGIGHFDGTSWSKIDLPFTVNLNAVWGSSPKDVWAVGAEGQILRYTSGRWLAYAASPTKTLLRGIWGSGPNDVWAVGYDVVLHFDGQSWTVDRNAPSERYSSVHGQAGKAPYLASENGGSLAIITRDAAGSWGPPSGPGHASFSAQDVWCAPDGSAFGVGQPGVAYRCDDKGCTRLAMPPEFADVNLRAVWGSSPSRVFLVSYQGAVLRYDGSKLSAQVATPSASIGVNALAGTATTLWAATERGVYQEKGGSWEAAALPQGMGAIRDIWALADNDIWITGDKQLAHFDGKSWTAPQYIASSGGYTLRGLWGANASEVYAVGYRYNSGYSGVLLRYDGSLWSESTISSTGGFWSIGGFASERWIAVGTYRPYVGATTGDPMRIARLGDSAIAPEFRVPFDGNLWDGRELRLCVGPSAVWVAGHPTGLMRRPLP